MGDAPKRVAWDENKELVYPDIIVHIREKPVNLLAIELKKTSNVEHKADDIKKLLAYKNDEDFLYTRCLFIRFGVKDQAGLVVEFDWI